MSAVEQQNKLFLASDESTQAIGAKIAKELRAGDIVLLEGPLGAGKTTLTRGIVTGFGGDAAQVHSPTFSLVHEYQCPTISINHCDFYRLAPDSELEDFGGLEFFSDPKIYLLEWPERISLLKFLPPERLSVVRLEHDANGRNIYFPKKWQILD